jgi:chemotaxis protein MotB
MKRLASSGLKVGAVLLMSALFSGCVSQGEYDALKFAQRNCEAERERLAAELAGAQNTNRTLEAEIARLKDLLKNREDIITALRQQMGGTKDALDKMAEIYKQLADKQIPIITTPLPPKVTSALEEFARNHPGVKFDAEKGVLKFSSDLLFDLGSANVKPEAQQALADFAKIMDMADAAEFDAVIVGHTDNVRIARASTRAQHPTNWHLSVHRAISVMEVLRGAGVAETRMGVMGYGEFRPVAENNSASNKAQNRRVEIYLVPKQKSLGGESSSSSVTPVADKKDVAKAAAEEEAAEGAEEAPAVEK